MLLVKAYKFRRHRTWRLSCKPEISDPRGGNLIFRGSMISFFVGRVLSETEEIADREPKFIDFREEVLAWIPGYVIQGFRVLTGDKKRTQARNERAFWENLPAWWSIASVCRSARWTQWRFGWLGFLEIHLHVLMAMHSCCVFLVHIDGVKVDTVEAQSQMHLIPCKLFLRIFLGHVEGLVSVTQSLGYQHYDRL